MPDLTRDEIEGLAAGLSEAQRQFVIKCGDPKRPFRGMWQTRLSAAEEFDLKQKGLVRWDTAPLGTMAPICRLVELGKQVRRTLLQEQSNG